MKLYSSLCCIFCLLVVLSNILSAKMVLLPLSNLEVPAGLLTYPLTFLIADLVTEIYGKEKAKSMVYTTLGINIACLALIQIVLVLPSARTQTAFHEVFELSSLRIFASLTAYFASQIVDIQLYTQIKKLTGNSLLWVRNNGATCISQFLDTIIVDLIYLYGGLGMNLMDVLPVILISFCYKTFFSVLNTPLFYLSVFLSKRSIQGVPHEL